MITTRRLSVVLVVVAAALSRNAVAQPSEAAVTSAAPAVWWSFRSPQRPTLPKPANSAWMRKEIDAFVLSRLEAVGLTPALEADRVTLIRRATFDLIGLPPTPEEVDAFVHDPAPDAYEKLIERLLASPHYGERWGRHWLDVARYADSGGYETDIYFRKAWRYRDYVVKAFNDDKPYDRFVQEQIAADELWPDDFELDGTYQIDPAKVEHLEARLGTGFYTLGPQIHESNMDAAKLQYEQLTDWVDTTASVFMGLTLGCARCHDHKFDPLSQADYYRLQAVFAGTQEAEVSVVHGMGRADYKQHYPKLVAVDEARKAYRLFERRVAGQRDKLTPQEQQEERKLLDDIARAVLALPEGDAQGYPYEGIMGPPTAAVLGHRPAALVRKIHVLDRGELSRPRQAVGPDVPTVLRQAAPLDHAMPGPFGSRKQLALWLTRPEHPLTARVMVNRLWLWHFGRGLVATPNDFGKMGQAPTHPELLDWLAVEFAERGWSLKAMHRLMMSSSTYRLSSRPPGEHEGGDRRHAAASLDPENALLWRANRRRLEGEALWDAMHAAAGTLTRRLGGRPVVPLLADDEIAALRERWHWPVSADPADRTRRGIYVLVRRNFRFPMFEVFDAPVNSVSCPQRDVTTVAPQALWFLNNRATLEQAQALAARLLRECGEDRQAQIERAWRLTLGRPPAERELVEATHMLKEAATLSDTATPSALVPLCLALFNLNEFAYVD